MTPNLFKKLGNSKRQHSLSTNDGSFRSELFLFFSRLTVVFVSLSCLTLSHNIALGQPTKSVKLGFDDAKIRELVIRRKYGKAARLISEKTDGALLVKGHLLLLAGKPRDALIIFSAVKTPPSGLHDFYHLRNAEAQLKIDEPGKAISHLSKVVKPNLVGTKIRLLKARATALLDKPKEARQAYRKILGSGRSAGKAKALFALAKLELDQKNHAQAFKYLKRLDVEFPSHWLRRRAKPLVKSLKSAKSVYKKRWGRWDTNDIITSAEKLLRAHRNKAVVKTLETLPKKLSDTALNCRKLFALGKALRKLRKWKRARPLLDEAVIECGRINHELTPWALHIAGKAAERLSDEIVAANIYRKQMKDHRTHRLADDGAYFVTRHLVEDQHDLDKAEAELKTFVSQFPDGDMMDRAIFFVAIHAFEKARYKQALRILDLESKLGKQTHNFRNMGRTEYWKARILGKLKRPKEARTQYLDAMRKYPLSWYSILAYSRLKEQDPKAATRAATRLYNTPVTLPFMTPADTSGVRWSQAMALAKHGLPRAAWEKMKGIRGKTAAQTWRMAELLHEAGAVHISHNILRRKLTEYRKSAPIGRARNAWMVAFPKPLKGLMSKAAKKAGVPVHLARSITREESGFHPALESGANAIGLMQLILPTAKSMADSKDGKINGKTLRNPDLNVRLGTRYLRVVYDRSKAVHHLVPAGYNAGAGALRRWLKKRGNIPLDLFVELIPYEEARGYTKRVNSSWATYALLDGQTTGPMYIPQNIFQKGHAPTPK